MTISERKNGFKNESDFTAWFCDHLKRMNASVVPLVGGSTMGKQLQQPGLPDRMITHKLLPMGIIFIEFKVDKRKATNKQALFMRDDLLAKGVCGVMCRGFTDSTDGKSDVIKWEVFPPGMALSEGPVEMYSWSWRRKAEIVLEKNPNSPNAIGQALLSETIRVMCAAHEKGYFE